VTMTAGQRRRRSGRNSWLAGMGAPRFNGASAPLDVAAFQLAFRHKQRRRDNPRAAAELREVLRRWVRLPVTDRDPEILDALLIRGPSAASHAARRCCIGACVGRGIDCTLCRLPSCRVSR